MEITKDKILEVFKKKKYKIETNMIIGIRSDYTGNFTDYIIVIKGYEFYKFEATTLSGTHYLFNPMNQKGTAILVEGQHLNAFKLGKHQGKYDALVQAKPLPIFRDNNKNNVPDLKGLIYNEMIGLNIHHAGTDSKIINNWSASCQVIANIQDWLEFYGIVRGWNQKYFSYTLINKNDLK
jgi:hypothetical protein